MENPFNELNDRLIRIENILIQLREIMQPGLKEDQDIWLNIQDAANFLQISKATLYGKTSKREIPFYKRGKRIFFKKIELIEWLEKGKKKTYSEMFNRSD